MLTSCIQNDFSEFEYKILKQWIFADQLKFQVSKNEIIERPPGVEILILQAKFAQKSHCVYYLVPFKNKLGVLTIVENTTKETCDETNSSKTYLSMNDIKNLKISLDNFHFKMSFEKMGTPKNIEIPMMNINNGNIHQKYKSFKVVSLSSGLGLEETPKNYLGKLDDRFSKGTALRCHQVNAKCDTLGEFRCNDCRYGWYEVADYNCPQGGSKFCGQNHCGEKNEPACPRGYKLSDAYEPGICSGDLTPVLNADHILVCQ
jgi:hypothetical protein